ncbi:MAG TPA: Uma2 family endonuclease [Gemmatimonadaceae bacterium]|nr:Uma2 family endonuclease [Gemmatimonadaceae bacterium]
MTTATKIWTLAEVHSLPDDGNKYELVHGVLYVTPAPGDAHETIAARLTRVLDPYVAAQGLGFVYHPRSVFRIGEEVEVEPDLMVRLPHPAAAGNDKDWESAPTPSLVVEILSPSTRRRDFQVKPRVYVDEGGIAEYWVVDPEGEVIHVYTRDHPRREMCDTLTWYPPGATQPLSIDLKQIFIKH